MTPEQLADVRALIEQSGFLPTTGKADRLFAAAEARSPGDPKLAELRRVFAEAGYLPRSKALRLVELAGGPPSV